MSAITTRSFATASTVTSIRSDCGESIASGHETDPTETIEPCTPRRGPDGKTQLSFTADINSNSPAKLSHHFSVLRPRERDEMVHEQCGSAGKGQETLGRSKLVQPREIISQPALKRTVASEEHRLRKPHFRLDPWPCNPHQVPNEQYQSQKVLSQTLNFSAKQLNRLMIALVNSPLVQFQVRRQWWDDTIAPWDSSTSESVNTPSLTSSDDNPSIDNTPAITPIIDLYCHDNFEQDIKSAIYNTVEDLVTEDANNQNVKGIAIVDSRTDGAPVILTTKDFHNTGHCTFAELAYGASTAVSLRIDPSLPRGRKTCTVKVRVTAQVQERRSLRLTALMIAEKDMTEAFARAALAEFTTHTMLDSRLRGSHHDEGDPDKDIMIDNAIAAFAHLHRETCTMQVLTLLSALERARRCYADFVVLHLTGPLHETGVPQSMNVPWVSASLAACKTSKSRERAFRERVVGLVAAHAMEEGPIVSTMPSDLFSCPHRHEIEFGIADDAGDRCDRTLHCMPLHNGAQDGCAVAWICFVRRLADTVAEASEGG